MLQMTTYKKQFDAVLKPMLWPLKEKIQHSFWTIPKKNGQRVQPGENVKQKFNLSER